MDQYGKLLRATAVKANSTQGEASPKQASVECAPSARRIRGTPQTPSPCVQHPHRAHLIRRLVVRLALPSTTTPAIFQTYTLVRSERLASVARRAEYRAWRRTKCSGESSWNERQLSAMWGGLFGKRKTAEDVTKALRDAIHEAQSLPGGRENKKSREEISRQITSLKGMLFTDGSHNGNDKTEHVMDLMRLAREGNLLVLLAANLSYMEFETRKDAVQIFSNLLERGLGDPQSSPVDRVAANNGEVLGMLVTGYDDADIALNCGHMLRKCIRYEQLTALLLESSKFWRFFDLVERNDLHIASDAFTTFKELLTRHVNVSAAFMERNLDQFVANYNNLIRSQNYVTRRQSLKLLGEMLLERANFKIMTNYIASPTNLQFIMNLLLDQRRNIQFEAFHVFKIFVANPNKPPTILHILVQNKERLLTYLSDFLSDRVDEQFQEDRNLILDEIRNLS